MNWPILLVLASFTLGQLTRVEILPGVQIYLHDVALFIISFKVMSQIADRKKLPNLVLTKPIIFFSIIAAISLLFGATKVSIRQAFIGSLYLFRWIAYSSLYFSVATTKNIKKKLIILNRKFEWTEALLIAGLAFSSFGLLQYIFLPDTRDLKWLGWDDHYFRLIGTLLDPGFTGIMLALIALLAISLKQSSQIKLFSIALAVISLLFTYSRASYLAFLAGLSVFVILKKRVKKGLVAATIFLAVLAFLPKSSGEGTNLLRLYSLFKRIDTWRYAIQIFKDHPLIGVGFNLMRPVQYSYGFVDASWQRSHSASGVENSYLFVLASTGITGFAAFAWLIYSMIKANIKIFEKRIRRLNPLILSSITAVSLHAIFTNTWFYPWVMLWMWYILGDAEADYSS